MLPKKLTFAHPDKILEMQSRWGEVRTEEARLRLEHDISLGRPGGIWLVLSAEEYTRLKRL